MVDSQPGDAALFQELENKLMDRVEDDRVLNSDRGEVVDVKESSVINLFSGNLPVAQAVGLRVQQLVKHVE